MQWLWPLHNIAGWHKPTIFSNGIQEMAVNYSSYKTALQEAETTIKRLGISETLAASFKEAERVVLLLDKMDGGAIDEAQAAMVTKVMKLVEGKITTTAQNGPMPTDDAGKQALRAQSEAVARFLKIAMAVRQFVEQAPSGKGKKSETKADAKTNVPEPDMDDWCTNKKLFTALHEFAKKRQNAECLEGYNLLRKPPSASEIAELLYNFGKGDYNLPAAGKYKHLAVKSKNSTAAVQTMQKDQKLREELQKLLKIMKDEFRESLKKDVINPYMLTAECMELLTKL